MKEQALSHVRRQDRAVDDDAWIRWFLKRASVGTLATMADGRPFLNSNFFVYDEQGFDKQGQVIYLHTARRGRTRENVERSESVCFTVSAMGRLLPAHTALEFSVEYAGIVVFGSARIVSDEDEASWALQLLLDKYFPHLKAGRDYRRITSDELARTSVYRVRIEQWSGKAKFVEQSFEGAFPSVADNHLMEELRARLSQ